MIDVHRLRTLWESLPVRNSTIYTIGNFLPQAVNVAVLPIFTRYLSTGEYGILAYTTAINVFLFVFGSLTIHSYVLRNWFDCKTINEGKQLFGAIFSFLLIFNLFLLCATMFFLPFIFHVLDIQVDFHPYVRFALLINFVEVMGVLPLTYLRVTQQAGWFVSLTLSYIGIGLLLSIYLIVYQDMGVIGRYYGLLGAGSVMLVVYLAITLKIAKLTWNTKQIRKAFFFSAPLTGAGLLYSVTIISDRLILERFVSLSEIGLYGVGFSIGSGLGFVANGIYKAVEPEIYRTANNADFDLYIHTIKRFVVLILLGFAFVLIGLSREIVHILTGPSFFDSYRVVQLITVAMLFQGSTFPISSYLVAKYRTKYIPMIQLTGALISITSNMFLIPFIGVYGAAIGAIMSYFVTLYVYKLITERYFSIRWDLNKDLLLIGIVCFIAFLISEAIPSETLMMRAVKITTVLTIVGIYYWRVAFSVSALELYAIKGQVEYEDGVSQTNVEH